MDDRLFTCGMVGYFDELSDAIQNGDVEAGRRRLLAECRLCTSARPTAAWPVAATSGVPAADCAHGARESALGLLPIRGELLKLGHQVAATAIRSVLLAAGIPPFCRWSQLTWKQFLTAHAETLVAADFFGVDTIFFKRLYVLIHVHLASRRLLLASCTPEPNAAWVTQTSLSEEIRTLLIARPSTPLSPSQSAIALDFARN